MGPSSLPFSCCESRGFDVVQGATGREAEGKCLGAAAWDLAWEGILGWDEPGTGEELLPAGMCHTQKASAGISVPTGQVGIRRRAPAGPRGSAESDL